MVRTRSLEKVHRLGSDAISALSGIDLDIERGEMVAITGASGSGKSTLLNLLGCLDRPTAGDYLLDGRSVADLGKDQLARVRNRKIGFVFQSCNLLARTDALDNVALPLVYRGIALAERRSRAEAALARVGLTERRSARPHQLSGGEQQRVAIARAVVTEPALLLADEPTGALDSENGRQVMSLLQALSRAGTTLVVVTHDPDVARHAQRVITLRDGRIVEDSLPAERPALSA